jgi:uncharacterized membrane protein
LIVQQRLLKSYTVYNGSNLAVLDGLSNHNKMGKDHLTMVMLTILTMNFQINMKKILKIEKKLMNMFFYL